MFVYDYSVTEYRQIKNLIQLNFFNNKTFWLCHGDWNLKYGIICLPSYMYYNKSILNPNFKNTHPNSETVCNFLLQVCFYWEKLDAAWFYVVRSDVAQIEGNFPGFGSDLLSIVAFQVFLYCNHCENWAGQIKGRHFYVISFRLRYFVAW